MATKQNQLYILVIALWIGHCSTASLVSHGNVSEQTILDLAEMSNKTFLKLIGLAIRNLRCDLDNCNTWSEWTADALYRGQFGVKTRSRDCYKSCNETGQKVVDNDSEIYEGKCQAPYNITDKFCFLFVTTNMNYSAAKKYCEKDGGQVINVDTKERQDLAQNLPLTSTYLYVQGERRVTGGPYIDDTGRIFKERPFFMWASGEPHNVATAMYLVLNKGGYYDATGTYEYNVLCEIRP